jgi:putative transcriptional regulator
MSRAADGILRGAREALDYAQGHQEGEFVAHVPDEIDIKSIREGLGLSQVQFARQFGFEPRTIQNWEHERRRPTGMARAYLRVIQKAPEAVRRCLE